MSATAVRPTTNQTYERSTSMDLMTGDLARAHVSARMEQAREQRVIAEITAARRLSRKAERAAAQARLALARVI